MRVNQKTLVLLADGQRATFLSNEAQGETISLKILHSMAFFNEANRDIQDDRPGHTKVGMSERGTSYEQNDKHQANELSFLQGVVGAIDSVMTEHELSQILLIAEPRALGVLRQHMPSALMDKVVTQLDKDYTKNPLPELEAILRQREA
jgi:protein required for attachment to host cells